jgi:trehalose synthase
MARLSEVQLNPYTDVSQYKKFEPEIFDNIFEISKEIRGRVIIHINSSSGKTGGVAELLRSQVPFEKAIGLESHWFEIEGAPIKFFKATKKIHNLLQGKPGQLVEKEESFYASFNQKLVQSLQEICQKFKSGIIVIHDPQPLPLIQSIPSNFSSVLRLHIDLSAPNQSIVDFLQPLIEKYSSVIVSNKDYLVSLSWLNKEKAKIIMPAIDPFSDKNREMEPDSAKIIIQKFGINPLKPFVVQVSRFDSWKNPLGVIQAYYLAKKEIENLQLVLAGFFFATDDPEAPGIFKTVQKHARGDQDIFLFAHPERLEEIDNDTFINALYTASTVMVQNSIREGFGLTITEAMWKSKVVIAGTASGALLQIKNGENGILASSAPEVAQAIVQLVKDKPLREKLGKAAHQSVQDQFLLPRFILENIKVYRELKSI